ncbi:MAG: hypothetical protein Kow0069_06500 [Promethearchaeota archaeon]
MSEHAYGVQVDWEARPGEPYVREARLSSPADDLPEFTVVTPPQFSGGIPRQWSPEHLFVGAIAACYANTFLAVAQSSRLPLRGFTVEGLGKLGQVESEGGAQTRVTEVALTLRVDAGEFGSTIKKKAERVALLAKKNCMIANSTRSEVNLRVVVE